MMPILGYIVLEKVFVGNMKFAYLSLVGRSSTTKDTRLSKAG